MLWDQFGKIFYIICAIVRLLQKYPFCKKVIMVLLTCCHISHSVHNLRDVAGTLFKNRAIVIVTAINVLLKLFIFHWLTLLFLMNRYKSA